MPTTSDPDDELDPPSGSELGFGLDVEAWLNRVRAAERIIPLGRHGPYELLGDIGRGGQGMVYKARQPKTGRIIAIKRLGAGVFSTSEMRARFEREIEAAASLEHPNIVTIFGSELVDEQPTLLMQWIDGVPFDRWASLPGGARRPLKEILTAFATICDAIHHAHQRGVIHRDLKPSNILVDAAGQPHVLDFGLAKLSMGERVISEMTQAGGFMGTPAYAAPEQLRGDPRALDVRTDVYSLGVVLYQALTGHMMFDASVGIAQLINDIQQGTPNSPSAHDPRIDREIDTIVLKAVAADSDRRYSSVEALAADIRRHLAGEAVLAYPPSAAYKLRKFAQQHRGLVFGWAMFVLLLTAATVISFALYLHARTMSRKSDVARVSEMEARDRAEKQESVAKHEFARATAVSGFLQEMLHYSDPAWYPGKAGLTISEVLDKASEKIADERMKYEPEMEAVVRMYVAISYVDLAQFARAEPHVRRALDLRMKVLGEDHPDTAVALHYYGRILRNLGRMSEAELMQRRVLAIRQRTLAPESPYIAQTLCSLGILLRAQSKFDDAEDVLTKAEGIYRINFGENDDVANCLKNMGGVQLARGCPAEADELLLRALNIFPKFMGSSHETIAGTILQLAAARQAHGASGESEALSRTALAMMQGLYPNGHPMTAMIEEKLGILLKGLVRIDEAEALLRDALAMRSQLIRDTYPDIPGNVIELAEVLCKQGKMVEAESLFLSAVTLSSDYLPAGHRAASSARLGLGQMYTDLNRFADAEQLLLTAINDLDDPAPEASSLKQQASATLATLYIAWNAAEPGAGHDKDAARWGTAEKNIQNEGN